MADPITLSLCLIVRNERANLGTCLSSVRQLVGEIVVVDTGSTDGTQQLATDFGARVIEIPWPGDFSAARNVGLDSARGAWILVLDADESIAPAYADALRRLSSSPPAAAYRFTQVGVDSNGREIQMDIVRLFPNRPDVRFQFPIHEQVDPSLARAGIPIRASGIEITHTGYDSPEKAALKRAHYRTIIEESLGKNPEPAMELHLRYLSAVNYLEDKSWERAGLEFERCMLASPSKTVNLYHFAKLRAAECFMLARDYERSLKLLPVQPALDAHPAARYVRAQIDLVYGHTDAAREWFSAITQVAEGPRVPPVDLSALKESARRYLTSPD